MNPIVRNVFIDQCQRPKKIWSGPRDIHVDITMSIDKSLLPEQLKQ